MKKIIFTLLFLLLLFADSAPATDLYVATTGNDTTGDGSVGNPWLTIQKGLRALSVGDTLYFRAGTYLETGVYGNNVLDTWGGVGTSWATATQVKPYPGETVTIRSLGTMRGDVNSVEYFVIDGSGGTLIFDGQSTGTGMISFCGSNIGHIKVTNVEVKNMGSTSATGTAISMGSTCGGTPVGNPHDIIFSNNSIHDTKGVSGSNQSHNLYLSAGTNITIEGNDIYNASCYNLHLFSFSAGAQSNFTIRNNRIRNAGVDGASPCAGILLSSGTGHNIYNNLIYSNKQGINTRVFMAGVNIFNNTLYDNDGGANLAEIVLDSGGSGIVLKNNSMWGGTGLSISDSATATVKSTNACTTALTGCSVTSDPLFTAPGSGDFTIPTGSPLKDAGATLGAPFNLDYLSVLRPQGAAYDIGAYEFQTAAATWNLTISSTNPTSAVGMTVSPNSVSPAADCSADTPITTTCVFNDATVVTVTAESPEGAGNIFTSWTGCNSVVVNVCTVTMSSARTITANYTDPPTGDNVAWWKLDEGTGTSAADSSGNSNTGTLTGAGGLPTWTTERGVSTVTFDKVDDSINVAASATLNFTTTNAFSFIATVKPTSTTGWQAIIIGDYLWGMYASIADDAYCGNGNPIIFFKSGAGTITWVACHNAPLSTTVETVLGGTYDGQNLIMYRQGKEVARIASGAVIDDSSASAVTIGKSTSYGEYFGGEIRNVKVWNIALTAAQMAAGAPSRISSGGGIAFGGKIGM